jgi:LPXTG-motif cell wall-anchored protein
MIVSFRRRIAALGVVLATAAATLLLAPLPAQAAPAAALPIDPAAVTAIEIHKFEQPEQLGQPANGLEQDTEGLTPVGGATFTAKLIPGIDLATNEGQAEAAQLTAADAADLVASEPVARSATTDEHGNATLAPLGVGLYYVQETVTPSGFTGAAPFLVALPLTNPTALDSWLTTVHVYPKNARVAIALDVIDRDAVKLGDVVEWLSRSDIPALADIDGYRVVQRIDPGLRLIDDGAHVAVGFDVPGAPALVLGTHYTRTADPVTGRIVIDFLPAGLDLLEQVIRDHPGAQVTVGYRTAVLAEGELVNEALLYPSRASIDGGPGAPAPVSDTNATKWGPIAVRVHERGNPSHLIQGARFKVYLTPEDAARGTNPVVIDGVDEWASDTEGMLHIPGLRFSNFADGLDRDRDDPLFRYYYVMPTYFPSGWTGVKEPLRTTVTSTTEVNVLTVVLWRERGLPITGAQSAGAALLGALLIGGGLLFLARRRRNRDEEVVGS